MIAREDKGVVGGVDYNRSPTVYFQTKGDEGNMTKVAVSDIKGSANGGFERIQKYCDRINKTSTDPFRFSSNNIPLSSQGPQPFSLDFHVSWGT